MIKNKAYSYLLVTSQFTCIGLLTVLNLTMFTKVFSMLLFVLGVGFFFYTLGFNKLSNFNIIPDIKKEAKLITKEPYRYIRHPMYFAVLLTMFAPLGNSTNSTNTIICLLLAATMFLKAKKEEILWQMESPQYQSYMKRTKMITPFIL